jgi:tryptophan synthase alpha chain
MSRIEQTFQKLKGKGHTALIPFVVPGDPNLKGTETLIAKMAENGADIIELGVPFSDPLADGPIIQSAYQRALKKKVHLGEVLGLARRLKTIETPLVLMTYFNPAFRYGLRNFAKVCKESGIEGVIIPDLPVEEAGPWIREAREMDLDTIFLVAPTSTPERMRKICRSSRGFIYYVSITGVTGVRKGLPDELENSVKGIREQSQKPVAVGFGISHLEQVKEINRFADGVIVGSAIVKMIEENLKSPELFTRIGHFVSSLAKVLK